MLADELRAKSLLFRLTIPPHGEVKRGVVKFRHVSVFGSPESGKTTFVMWMLSMVERAVTEAGVDFMAVRAMTLSSALRALDLDAGGGPVYIALFVDDAEAFQTSFRQMSGEVVSAMRAHDNIRHLLSRRGVDTAYVLLVYATQRFKNLQSLFRQGHGVVFKAVSANDPHEEKMLSDWLGDDVLEDLRELTSRIYLGHEDDAKSYYYIRVLGSVEAWEKMGRPGERPRGLKDVWLEDLKRIGEAGEQEDVFSRLLEGLPPQVAGLLRPKELLNAIVYIRAIREQVESLEPEERPLRVKGVPQVLKILGVVNPVTGEVDEDRLMEIASKIDGLF